MTFVITQGCCSDATCVSVCPVQCIRPRPGDPDFTAAEQLYIDPRSCIDCGACMNACPVEAIHYDQEMPEHLAPFVEINAAWFDGVPPLEVGMPERVRLDLPAEHGPLSVAIVGTGPSACYAADLLTQSRDVEVWMVDRLPVPFGLARAGVAPDHTGTRRMVDSFREVLARENVHCRLNVEVGRHLTLEELSEHVDAVIWAAGASGGRRLGIPGEDLPGVASASQFVAWYNGHPDAAGTSFELGEDVVVIGNGNVALDVARVLTLATGALERSEISDHALRALHGDGGRRVTVAARRGPGDAAYSLSEVLALEHLDGVDLLAQADEVTGARATGPAAANGTDLLADRKLGVARRASRREARENRSITLRYLLVPLTINGTDRVESVTFARHEVVDVDGIPVSHDTGERETVPASLVLTAVGHRGEAADSVPVDSGTGSVPNASGRVLDAVGGQHLPGLYAVGWIKRGAVGGIGANRVDAHETVRALLADVAAGTLPASRAGTEQLDVLLRERQPDLVDDAAWRRIDAAERAAGAAAGRPRVPFTRLEDMVTASRSED